MSGKATFDTDKVIQYSQSSLGVMAVIASGVKPEAFTGLLTDGSGDTLEVP